MILDTSGIRAALAKLTASVGTRTRTVKRRSKCGRTRIKLAAMIAEQLQCECEPEKMWVQNPTFANWDLARWGVQVKRTRNGLTRTHNVHSWDTMSNIVKTGKIAVVGQSSPDDPWREFDVEICGGE